jgi:lipoprotein LprG
MGAALAGCGGAATVPQASTLSAAQRLAGAKLKVDAASSLHLTVRSSGIPATSNGVLGADGSGTHAPAFKGTLDARIGGFQAKVEVVALGTVLYLKLPFTTEFVQADPRMYHAPNPAQLFATEGGITSLLTATTAPVEGKETRAGADVLATVTGKLPGQAVLKLLDIGDPAQTFDVTYGITDPGGELRSVTMIGPFYQGSTSTYTLTLDKYGAPVEISKP